MKIAGLNYSIILSNTPKAWQDFELFYLQEFKEFEFLIDLKITQLPFEMQLGILLRYFTDNGVEIDFCNTEYAQLPERIMEAFISHEKAISHYS